MSKLSERFFRKLNKDLGIEVPEGAYLKATRSGYWQRASGACSSVITMPGGSRCMFEALLFAPVKELVKCPNLIKHGLHGDLYIECGCKGLTDGRHGR